MLLIIPKPNLLAFSSSSLSMNELDSSSLLIIEPLSQAMAVSLTTRSALEWPFTRGTENNEQIHSEACQGLVEKTKYQQRGPNTWIYSSWLDQT